MTDERYEYVKAIIDCDELSWEYRIVGSPVTGKMEHDELVEGWSKREIIDLTRSMLDIPDDQRDVIHIEYR